MDEPSQEKNNFSRRLTCIEYPGIVRNEDKMLETLGGLGGISRVVSNPGLRLGLKFRPDDVFCKSVYGRKEESRGLLLKVKFSKTKTYTRPDSDENLPCFTFSVMGCIDKSYVFDSLCDFQYLPLAKTEEGKVENIHDQIIPTSIPDKEWMNQPGPTFLIPAYFSRVDTPFPYCFRTEPKDAVESTKVNLIMRSRKRRICKAACTSFHSDTVPQKPTAGTMKGYFAPLEPDIQLLKKVFEDRPIWSRGGLMQTTKLSETFLKRIINFVAYFYADGPWRCMWVRFGYDPKKDSSSRIYQMLTYRSVRSGVDAKIEAYRKRKNHHIPSEPSKIKRKQSDGKEYDFIFKPGSVPPMKFVYYQLCDIHLPEVIAMLDRLPPPSPNDACDEKNGFLPPGFIDQVREILKKYIMQELTMSNVCDSPSSSRINEGASTSRSLDCFPDEMRDSYSLENLDSTDEEDLENQYWDD